MQTDLDDRIDALYQLKLDDFTAARNALAKEVRGADAATLRALKKPTALARGDPWGAPSVEYYA